MPQDVAERFMHLLQQFESSRNIEPLVSVFSERCVVRNLAIDRTHHPLTGRDGARQFWQDYLRVFRDVRTRFLNLIESGDTAVLEWESEGHLRTGQPIHYRGVSILELDDGEIVAFRGYYDSAALKQEPAQRTMTA